MWAGHCFTKHTPFCMAETLDSLDLTDAPPNAGQDVQRVQIVVISAPSQLLSEGSIMCIGEAATAFAHCNPSLSAAHQLGSDLTTELAPDRCRKQP